MEPIQKSIQDPLWVRALPTFMPIIIGIVAADLVTDLAFWQLFEVPKSILVPRPSEQSLPTVSPRIKGHVVSDLLARNIFDHTNFVPGQEPETEASVVLDPEQAVPSSLPYTVLGTIVFDDPWKSLAVLEKSGKVHRLLKEDVVDSGHKIWEVHRKKVFIHNVQKNRLEYLAMKERIPALGVSTPQTLPPRVAPATGPKEIKQLAENQFSVEKDYLRKKLEGQNLLDLLSQAKAIPTPDGFRIETMEPGSLYEVIGLQPGDVIGAINDRQVRNQADALMLYNQFKSATLPTLQLQILRNGEPTTLRYDLKDKE